MGGVFRWHGQIYSIQYNQAMKRNPHAKNYTLQSFFVKQGYDALCADRLARHVDENGFSVEAVLEHCRPCFSLKKLGHIMYGQIRGVNVSIYAKECFHEDQADIILSCLLPRWINKNGKKETIPALPEDVVMKIANPALPFPHMLSFRFKYDNYFKESPETAKERIEQDISLCLLAL